MLSDVCGEAMDTNDFIGLKTCWIPPDDIQHPRLILDSAVIFKTSYKEYRLKAVPRRL